MLRDARIEFLREMWGLPSYAAEGQGMAYGGAHGHGTPGVSGTGMSQTGSVSGGAAPSLRGAVAYGNRRRAQAARTEEQARAIRHQQEQSLPPPMVPPVRYVGPPFISHGPHTPYGGYITNFNLDLNDQHGVGGVRYVPGTTAPINNLPSAPMPRPFGGRRDRGYG